MFPLDLMKFSNSGVHFAVTMCTLGLLWNHLEHIRSQKTLMFPLGFHDSMQLWGQLWTHIGIEIPFACALAFALACALKLHLRLNFHLALYLKLHLHGRFRF